MFTPKKKVLVIEDSSLVREAVRLTLESNGFHVTTALDGEEGLFRAVAEQPDEIVMDWMLPKLCGRNLIQMLNENERTKRIPVIVLSARSKSELGEGHEVFAVRDYLKKDSNVLDRLVEALRQNVPALV